MTHDLAASMADAARTIHRPHDLEETLRQIVDTATLSFNHLDQVTISSIDSKGKMHTLAASADLARRLDRVQYDLDEGPCVDGMKQPSGAPLAAPSIQQSDQWPNYLPEAVANGVRSQLAVRLYLDDAGTIGGLNMYSTTSDDIDPEDASIAELFAAHAAVALGSAREVDNLNQALASRKTIGMAMGLVMHEYTLTEAQAFAFLVRTSSTSNVKLRDIASQLVQRADEAARRSLN
jgi:GAF domain-containing protein